MVTLAGAAWAVFWVVMGRSMHNFDFAASSPAHVQVAPFTSPAYYLVLAGRYMVVAVLAAGIPGIIAGAGLLRQRSWGRSIGIVVSVIDILLVNPIHLFLGIYGLVILLKPETGRLFARQTER